MGTTLEKFYKDQLTDFKKILNTGWSVGGAYIKTIEPRLKPIHKRYLSLACLSTVVGYRSQRNEYIEGVVETAHFSLIMAMGGYPLDSPKISGERRNMLKTKDLSEISPKFCGRENINKNSKLEI